MQACIPALPSLSNRVPGRVASQLRCVPLRSASRGARADGFSLIEVLAAFVVLALVGTALFRLFAGALGNVSLAEEYSRATLYAESRLTVLGNEGPLREGTQQGTSEDGRFTWTSRIEPYKPADAKPDLNIAPDTSMLRLWHLAVEVHWPGGAFGNDRTVALSTVRAATRELAAQ